MFKGFWSLKALVIGVALGAAGSASAQQTISIDGSTGTAPLVEALGKAFSAKRGITVQVGKGLGTKARFEALSAGRIDIAMASHGLNVGDITKRGMTVHRIAMAPVLFGVHEAVTVKGLTDEQICSIYEGKVRNWKEVGGSDLAIVVLVRPESEVDMEVVRDGIACFKNLKIPEGTQSLARAGDMARALAETQGAIGMTSATFVAQSKGKIKAVSLNGASADEASVLSGKYRLTRDAFLVVGKSPTESVNAFIAFVKSQEGAAIIKQNGAIASKN
ncbi:MAG: substrate-binding domain-containing protein [Xanthobacteraceae bacterium]|nr:substrate-binding domain-containing protein [Xanthobacteraceae bacterium]